MLTNAPKGTKDVLPEQIYKWHFVEKQFEDLCKTYGFKEVRTPVFEHTELFLRGVGETTDIVQKETYTFEDYGHRSITLRPEGTAPVVRAFVQNKQYAEIQPTKYFYNIACFRYEKPQSGRLRAFHQFGVEIFGTDNMMADAEVISLAHEFIIGLGIKDVELRINSIGCPECRKKYRDALCSFLKPKYDLLCDTCKERYERNPMRVFDCKSPLCKDLIKEAPIMMDYLCDSCACAFSELKSNLEVIGIEYVVDTSIVRGLDYYTKTAFEFISKDIGAQGTVCGGGRYDHLIEELGGPPIPGVGFGLGIERLLLTMEAAGIKIEEPEGPDAFIAFMGDAAKYKGLELMRNLRNEGFNIQMDLLARKFKGQFKYADRIGAKNTIVLGDDEISEGKATIKDMKTGDQEKVSFENIGGTLRKKASENI